MKKYAFIASIGLITMVFSGCNQLCKCNTAPQKKSSSVVVVEPSSQTPSQTESRNDSSVVAETQPEASSEVSEAATEAKKINWFMFLVAGGAIAAGVGLKIFQIKKK